MLRMLRGSPCIAPCILLKKMPEYVHANNSMEEERAVNLTPHEA